MATAVASKVIPRPVGTYDRAFYSSIAITMALTVFVGFAPTFYLKMFGSGPMATISGSPFTPLVYAHAALFTSWVLLFIVQTALVASHRVAVHRRMGIVGGVLAAMMVIAGTSLAISGAARGMAPPGIQPLAFLAVPLFDMLFFSSLVGAALWFRANKETHKRLMLLGYISIMAAAVARWPGVFPMGPVAFYGDGKG